MTISEFFTKLFTPSKGANLAGKIRYIFQRGNNIRYRRCSEDTYLAMIAEISELQNEDYTPLEVYTEAIVQYDINRAAPNGVGHQTKFMEILYQEIDAKLFFKALQNTPFSDMEIYKELDLYAGLSRDTIANGLQKHMKWDDVRILDLLDRNKNHFQESLESIAHDIHSWGTVRAIQAVKEVSEKRISDVRKKLA